MSICVFGDSIAWGAWDEERGGWVNRLKLSLESKDHESQIYNLAIDGETSHGVLDRLEAETAPRSASFAIVAIGTNDSATDDSGNLLISAQQFEENLREIVATANDASVQVIFVDLPRVDESKTNPVSWANIYYSNEDLDKYSASIKTIAEESNSFFCSIQGLLDKEDLADGLHPNEGGHMKIAEAVENFLINNNIVTI